MENNRMEFNPDMDEMKAQYRLFTEKIAKENIVTSQQLCEVKSGKARNYEFKNTRVCFAVLFILSPYVVYRMYGAGYPLWTYFSIVYMWCLVLVFKLAGYRRSKIHIIKLGREVVQYVEEIKWESSNNGRYNAVIFGLFIPVCVHLAFYLWYILTTGRFVFGSQVWWVYGVTAIICVVTILMYKGKSFDRILVMINR